MLYDSHRHKIVLKTDTKFGWESESYGPFHKAIGYSDRDHRPSWKNTGKGSSSATIVFNTKDGSLSLDVFETAETGVSKRVMLDLPPEIVQAIKKAIG